MTRNRSQVRPARTRVGSGREELVLTPGGWREKSKVHHVAEGEHVHLEDSALKIIHSESGMVTRQIALGHTRLGTHARGGGSHTPYSAEATPRPSTLNPAPITDRWIVYSGWSNASGNPISFFKTRWAVPPPPTTDHGQTIFLFNGIEPGDGSFILQPVLQWGSSHAGGGSNWTITNWFVGSDGTALFGSLISVNPGDVLEGIMTLTGQTGSNFNYLCSFAGFPTIDLVVNNVTELTWANETLECYDVAEFSDYPDTALTAFHDIEIRLRTSTSPFTEAQAAINWSENNDVTDNGQRCVAISNASPNGDVYLYYRSIAQGLHFVNDKSTFGRDEVTDVIADSGGRFPNAFWLLLEGYTIDQLQIGLPSPAQPTLSGPFHGLAGITQPMNSSGVHYELPGDLYTPQRIRFPYDVRFTNTGLAAFPAPGSAPVQELLNGSIAVGSTVESAATLFELVGGADPYFTNIDPTQDNVFWLSQDLRVFSAAPALNNVPVAGGPTFTTDSFAGAYSYIQALLAHLNTHFKSPTGVDPFSSLLPGQIGALEGDSSVTPIAIIPSFPIRVGANYNFAVARVRLRGSIGPAGAAHDVKVFFRLWATQTADTDYAPSSTYLSNTDTNGLPDTPLPGTGNHTIPFFATSNHPNFSDPSNPEYGTNGVNNRTLQIDSGDDVWAYFGCFLNVYDASNTVGGTPVQALLAGTHHCIVAQIAHDDSPIINAAGVIRTPENCDKLAQRNLQMTHSDNPGPADTHRIPQTFDLRPSKVVTDASGLVAYPDELMIDWGNTPEGSIASIYWPQVDSAHVLKLASKLYTTHQLESSDAHTLRCKVTKGVTYVPIPAGSGENFAGLLTIDLPLGVVTGQEFNIVVRRITTLYKRPQQEVVIAAPSEFAAAASRSKASPSWRAVVGTFQVKIPVTTKEVMLLPEENTLAVLKWRLGAMVPTNRWYPVLQRYIGYVSARIDGLGGNSSAIGPSLDGVVPSDLKPKRQEHTGKVVEILYDCFGQLEGFVLVGCCAKKHLIPSREPAVGRLVLHAFEARLTLSVWLDTMTRSPSICRIAVVQGP